jgi:hypothetical protein
MVANQANRINHQFREAIEHPAELVKDHPLPSMLFLFGIGIGVGVVVSQVLCSSMMEMVEPEPTMTEKVLRQVYDALTNVVPPSMLKQIQSYTS